MPDNSFFDVSKEQSRVKAAIVAKYFEAWANVIIGTQDRYAGKYGNRILYLDLFAGPGRYEDGTTSTPLLVLEKAISNPKLRERLSVIFNDRDEDNIRSLQTAINSLPGIETLRYKPVIHNQVVGSEIVKMFEQAQMLPTFFFIDPWGYKGLSLQLVNSVLKDWGCDCVFFFNYTRINMGLPNVSVEEPLNALFGKTRADILRSRIYGLSPEERELTIVEELCEALKATVRSSRNAMAQPYVLPFRFKNDSGKRTSHHLIFVSKGFEGYKIMKEIMAKASSEVNEGVATFEYSPASMRQPLLFQLSQPLSDLGNALLKTFAGRTLTMQEIYMEHNVDRPYISRNYKDALLSLEKENKITVTSPPGKNRRAGSFADDLRVAFPQL